MLLFDKKRALTQILGDPKKMSEGGESRPSDSDQELHSVASELITAIEAKDAAGVAIALKTFVMACQSNDSYE